MAANKIVAVVLVIEVITEDKIVAIAAIKDETVATVQVVAEE